MPEQKKLIQFKNIVKSFEDGQVVLKGVSLDIYENEFVTLLGPSGCGKTTLLRILGGFLQPTEGKVLFDGEDIVNVPPYKREINTVFQKYALFPHMNVYDNIAFGLTIKKEPKDVIAQKVMRMLRLVSLEDYADRNVTELSGGQQQRIAIARALVNEPSVLLLDEPLGALDLKLRKEMQQELKYIQQEVGITFIFVTHDQEEALTMSDKIVVMNAGEIQQIGTPTEIYRYPVNEFVANFIGETNIIDGVMQGDDLVVFEDKKFPCRARGFNKNEKVDVVIRPEHLDIVPRSEGMLKGVVKSQLFKGMHYDTVVETRVGTTITVKMQVSQDRPVLNADAGEKISASAFLIDVEDVGELDDAKVVALASAEAWDVETEEPISIKNVEYDIKPEVGSYSVTFTTAAGTSITVKAAVMAENRVESKVYQEEIYAMNFFKKVEDIQESIALDTDLETWASASAWSLEDGEQVEITDVKYDFDPETIEPGVYDVTFSTEGYEYKVSTTRACEEGAEVGLIFRPEDIHVMKKEGAVVKQFRSMTYPYVAWISVMIVLPMLLIVLYAFTVSGNEVLTFQFTFDNFKRFVTDTVFMEVLGRSLYIAVLTTLICIALGYPIAYAIAQMNSRSNTIMILLITMPTWVNMLVRTYAWMGILQDEGILNTILGFFGIGPVSMIHTSFAVILGMVYNFIPFMILQIHTSLAKMDKSLLEAANDLGATPVQAFLRVTLPLSLPGVISGITLVFLPAVSSFFIPKLLGGGQFVLVGNIIESQFLTSGDWNFGSAISLIMAIIIMLSMWLTRKVDVQPASRGKE